MNPICPQDLTPCKVLSAPTNCQLAADLEIGTANPSTAYDVFIVNDGSKKVLKYDIVSSVSGILTIDLTVNPLFFNNSTTYTLFVVADGDDVANFVPIDGAYDGFLLTFWRSDTAAPSTQMIQPV